MNGLETLDAILSRNPLPVIMVSALTQRAAEIFQGGCLGIIMTGMGYDGADGCRMIREKGGYVLAELPH
jgi:chemotaxis response regulator CheB